MKKLLPVILASIGMGGVLAAGTMLKPADTSMAGVKDAGHADSGHGEDKHADAGHGGGDGHGKDDGHGKSGGKDDYIYVGLDKPFFAPVTQSNRRQTLVRLDIHLEVPKDMEDKVSKHDPKLRDGFLRTVMHFASEGGFARVHGADGFAILRDDLLLSARSVLGNDVRAVLIGEILTREG